MSIHPDSNFPLLAGDQAEVIQIFLELMIHGDRAGRAPEATTDQPVGPLNDSSDSWVPGAPSDPA